MTRNLTIFRNDNKYRIYDLRTLKIVIKDVIMRIFCHIEQWWNHTSCQSVKTLSSALSMQVITYDDDNNSANNNSNIDLEILCVNLEI